jgi:hypothetical protein
MARSNGDISSDLSRLTVPNAAKALGISPEAVRNRLSRGTLDSEKENGTVYVLLPTDRDQHIGDRPQYTDDTPPDISRDVEAAAELVDAKDETIHVLREQLEAERAANRENRRLLAAALERIPAIEAPADTASPASRDASVTSSEDGSGTPAPPQEEQVPWWRRLLGM